VFPFEVNFLLPTFDSFSDAIKCPPDPPPSLQPVIRKVEALKLQLLEHHTSTVKSDHARFSARVLEGLTTESPHKQKTANHLTIRILILNTREILCL